MLTSIDFKPKYAITPIEMSFNGVTVHRIIAIRDIYASDKAGLIQIAIKGELGGWIESPSNLSQFDECWVKDNAVVYGNAVVKGDAFISENATVYENAVIEGNAVVTGAAEVYGNAKVSEKACITGRAKVYEEASVIEGIIEDFSQIRGNAIVNEKIMIGGNTIME